MSRSLHRVLSCAFLLLILSCGVHNTVLAQSLQEEILHYTNKYRAKKGKAPLVLNSAAGKEAEKHSRAMASGRSPFGHSGFEKRIGNIKEKMGKISSAAENVAYGDLSAKQVVDLWIKSPGHRKNLLGDYNLIGIGYSERRDVIYFTQIFIKK